MCIWWPWHALRLRFAYSQLTHSEFYDFLVENAGEISNPDPAYSSVYCTSLSSLVESSKLTLITEQRRERKMLIAAAWDTKI